MKSVVTVASIAVLFTAACNKTDSESGNVVSDSPPSKADPTPKKNADEAKTAAVAPSVGDSDPEAYCQQLIPQDQLDAIAPALPFQGAQRLAAKMANCTWEPKGADTTLVLVQIDCRDPYRFMETSVQLHSKKDGYGEIEIGDRGIVYGNDKSVTFIFKAGPCGTSMTARGGDRAAAEAAAKSMATKLATEVGQPK